MHDRRVKRILDRSVSGRETVLLWRRRRCRVLLVDETSMRRRHRYVTVIVNGDTGEHLDMIEHRSAEALSSFLLLRDTAGAPR